MGIRKYKEFLKGLNKKKDNLIDRQDLKYFSVNFGINFSDKEMDFIYSKLDRNRNNYINFLEFIDSTKVKIQ